MSRVARLNLTLRALMETGIVLGLATWGVHAGDGPIEKILLGIGAPTVGFGFWGAVDFHRAGRAGEGMRLVQELLVSGLAAAALYAAAGPVPGIILAALSILHHAVVYASGARLLDRARAAHAAGSLNRRSGR
jgi:hypothetical protein